MQPILVPYEAQFRSNMQKHWSSGWGSWANWTHVHWGPTIIFAIGCPFKMAHHRDSYASVDLTDLVQNMNVFVTKYSILSSQVNWLNPLLSHGDKREKVDCGARRTVLLSWYCALYNFWFSFFVKKKSFVRMNDLRMLKTFYLFFL